jgi:hypothetical protein
MAHPSQTKPPAQPVTRRALLTAGPAGLAGAALASSASAAEPPREPPPEPEDARRPLYRETAHVRAYYARARG